MCVGLSARVVNVTNGTALIDANGAQRKVSAGILEDLEPGDFVMVHAGVAIAKITADPPDRRKTAQRRLSRAAAQPDSAQ